MPGPLLAPSKDLFDPNKDYSRVRWIGDRKWHDFEAIEEQQIQDSERKLSLDRIFQDGVILDEAGGTISPARQGVKTGNITAISSGVYSGFETQLYTLRVTVGGVGGAAKIKVTSDGSDNGNNKGEGYEFTIDPADLLDGKFFYNVGRLGVQVAFSDPKIVKQFIVDDTWTILGASGRRLPDVFPNHGVLAPNPILIYSRGRVRRAALPELGTPQFVSSTIFTLQGNASSLISVGEKLKFVIQTGPVIGTVNSVVVNGTNTLTTVTIDESVLNSTISAVKKTLAYAITSTGISQVFIEVLRTKVTAAEDPDLLDPFTLIAAAEREKITATFKTSDTIADPLPANGIEKVVFPVYHWDRATNAVSRVAEKPMRFELDQIPGALPAEALVDIDFNEELKGTFARRTDETNGSFLVEGFKVVNSTNPNPFVNKALVTAEPGIAYVNGVRIESRIGLDLALDLPTESSSVSGEVKTFKSGTSTYSLNKAIGDTNLPINSVTNLQANIRVIRNVTHDGATDVDPLPDTPVVKLVSVSQGSINFVIGTSAATPGADVFLAGDTADWNTDSPTNTQPVGGSSVTYEYEFNKVLVQGTGTETTVDYNLVDALNEDGRKDSVKFNSFVSPPSFAPTVAQGGTGNVDLGVHRWRVTFVHASGETDGGPMTGPLNVSGSSSQVDITNIPTGPIGIVTARKIYRTVAGAIPATDTSPDNSSFKLVGTVSDNTTTIFTDDVADSGLGANIPVSTLSTPKDGSLMFISYDFNLPRKDVVFARQDGTIDFVKGDPSEQAFRPKTSDEVLPLAEAFFKDGATTPIITNFFLYRVTFIELRTIIRQLDNLQFNFAQQQIFNQIESKDTAGFKGIVTDALASLDFADQNFNRPAGAGGDVSVNPVVFDAIIDTVAEELQLPRVNQTAALVPDISVNPSGHTAVKLNANWATLPFTAEAVITQSKITEETNVNPFNTFTAPPPIIELRPDRDFFINVSQSSQTQIHQTRIHANIGPTSVNQDVVTARTRRVIENEALFMRQIPVTIIGRNFVPGEDNIIGTMAGRSVALTPVSGSGTTVGSSIPHSVKAVPSEFDPNGNLVRLRGDFQASFTVPDSMPTGQRTVEVQGGSGSISQAVFTGFGLNRRIINIVVLQRTTFWDPVAQTFAFSEPTDIVKAIFPLATKGSAATPLTVEVREVIQPGGFPGFSVFAEKVFESADLTTGTGSANTFDFPDPLYFPDNQYGSLTYLTSSNEYRVYTATLGHATIATTLAPNPEWVTQNPNIRGTEPAGIFLASLNALNWEPRSTTALTYTLFRAKYDVSSAYLYCKRIDTVSWTHMFVAADEAIPEGTSIEWEYSVDGVAVKDGAGNPEPTKVWKKFVPFSDVALGQLATSVDIRAKLVSSTFLDSNGKPRISPRINKNNLMVLGMKIKPSGTYVSVANDFLTLTNDEAIKMKFYAEVNVPSGTEIKFYASNGEASSTTDTVWELIDPVLNADPDPGNDTSPGAIFLSDNDLPAGDGFVTRAYGLTFDNTIAKEQKSRIRLRVDMIQTLDSSGNPVSPTLTPKVRKIGTVIEPINYP